MTQKLKKIAFLVPRPGLAIEAFRRHWRVVHGPLVAQSPGYFQYRHRYVQNHVIDEGPIGQAFAYAGVAEFWLPQQVSNEEDFSRSSIYQERIRVDEEKFIDMNSTVSVTAAEQVIAPANGAVKLIVLSSRAPGMTEREFRAGVAVLLGSTLEDASFRDSLRGWTLNHVLEGSFRFPGARPAKETGIDLVQELWFDSREGARRALAASAFRTQLQSTGQPYFRTDGHSSFFAEEVVFFDRGKPLTPPR